jgi:hypothetical protein
MATILRGAPRLEWAATAPELPRAGILASATALKCALKKCVFHSQRFRLSG